MHLKNISIFNFKNYPELQQEFSPAVNCFTGNNGLGKTNLLDAIHYLSTCKSYFNSTDSQNILSGKEFFIIQGDFIHAEGKEVPGSDSIYCSVSANARKIFKRNKKEYSRLSEHFGLFPCVMIAPEDVGLIHEGSKTRRRFIDHVISQYDRNYLEQLIRYNKALEHRDALLKNFGDTGRFDIASLEIWNHQLIDTGNILFAARKKFLENFIPVFRKYFQFLTDDDENVTLSYESQLHDSGYEKLLHETLSADRHAMRTTGGIHKDDLEFSIQDRPVKIYASQGQQKSYLIALKLAQYEYVKEIKGASPILLLDDVFDKLDNRRIHALMQLVSSHHFGQIFITDTDENRIRTIFNKINVDLKLFKISKEKILVS